MARQVEQNTVQIWHSFLLRNKNIVRQVIELMTDSWKEFSSFCSDVNKLLNVLFLRLKPIIVANFAPQHSWLLLVDDIIITDKLACWICFLHESLNLYRLLQEG